MNYGYVKIALCTPSLRIADCFYNAKNIIEDIKTAYKEGSSIVAFPELSITGYTCSDLFLQDSLLDLSKKALRMIIDETKDINITSIIGMPIEMKGKLYNCGVCIYKGEILGIVPKEYIPNYNEFYEKRHFNTFDKDEIIKFFDRDIADRPVYFGKIIFRVENVKHLSFAIEICEDLWATIPPSSKYSLNGANIIINLSASNETVGKSEYRRQLVKNQSARCICAYAYVSAGSGESTTDLVFSGHNIITENGTIVSESEMFKDGIIYGDIDIEHINNERRRNSTFRTEFNENFVNYKIEEIQMDIKRVIDKEPFIPKGEYNLDKRCEQILNMQAHALKKRIEHIGIKNVVVGISGGLDSTLALIVLHKCYELLNYDKKDIIAVTMPCFGTSSKTYKNAKLICQYLGVTLLDINIENAVKLHFDDIGHNKDNKNVVYENAQARERTKVLMNLANKYSGIVLGTGDLSELALGFATYNGDHMSMYGINSSLPKTLIKHIVRYKAKNSDDKLKEVLLDILDTPISPELLPSDKDSISHITEDIVGPYELSDFFLYQMLRNGFSIEKIYYLSKIAFKGEYDSKEILKWLEIFYKRFFAQQFKRSCMPDGVKIGSVSLSPRGDFRMPSDASIGSFIKIIKRLKDEN